MMLRSTLRLIQELQRAWSVLGMDHSLQCMEYLRKRVLRGKALQGRARRAAGERWRLAPQAEGL